MAGGSLSPYTQIGSSAFYVHHNECTYCPYICDWPSSSIVVLRVFLDIFDLLFDEFVDVLVGFKVACCMMHLLVVTVKQKVLKLLVNVVDGKVGGESAM